MRGLCFVLIFRGFLMANSEARLPEELRLGELLRRLKVSHAWTLLGVVAGLLAGAFLFGYKTNVWVHGYTSRPATVSAHMRQFLVDYNRYITTRDSLFTNLTRAYDKDSYILAPESLLRYAQQEIYRLRDKQEEFKRAEGIFFTLIRNWYTRQITHSSDLKFEPEYIDKRGIDPRNSRVIFADGTEVSIPPEIKEKVLKSVSPVQSR
jgi:hypothetical protein